MRIPIPRWFPVLVLLILLYSPFSQLSGLFNVLQGHVNNLSVSQDGLFTRAIRELLLLVTYLYWFGWHLLHARQPFESLSRSSALAVGICAAALIAFSAVSIISTETPLLLLAHFKFVEYFPLGGMLYTYFRRYDEHRPIVTTILHRSLVGMIALQFLVALGELFVIPPFYGRTFLGPRVMGLYESPNSLSLTVMLMWLTLLTVGYRRRWLDALVFLLLLMAGSRTSIICFAALFFFSVKRLTPRTKFLAQAIGLFSVPGILVLASSKAISGRAINGEGRLDVVRHFVESLTGLNLWIGQGWGISSNVLVSLYGHQALDKLFVADSMYLYMLSNFGVIGIILLGLLAALYWNRLKPHQRSIATRAGIVVALASTSVVLIEAYPTNILLIFLLAYIVTAPDRPGTSVRL